MNSSGMVINVNKQSHSAPIVQQAKNAVILQSIQNAFSTNANATDSMDMRHSGQVSHACQFTIMENLAQQMSNV
jgi:hypothetical protein